MIAAAVDISHNPATIDDQCGRMRDVDSIQANPVIQAVCLGYATIFVQKNWERNRMFGEELGRLMHPLPLLRRNEDRLRPYALDLLGQRLELSHALDAIRSPGPAQEFQNQISGS